MTLRNQTTRQDGGRRLQATLIAGASLVLWCVVAGVVLRPYLRYEATHDLPNPMWGTVNRSYTYTALAGPPASGLVDAHPDTIVEQYITDYATLEGTYPCAANLMLYQDDNDPVFGGQRCTVSRPIAAVAITSVLVGIQQHGPGAGGPLATVSYTISYVDGEQWSSSLALRPDTYQNYFFAYIQLDCWVSPTTLAFYPQLVARVPPGVQYITETGEFAC